METTMITYEGTVERDPFGSWSDCSPGLYFDRERVEDLFEKYENQKIRVTIEVLEEDKD